MGCDMCLYLYFYICWFVIMVCNWYTREYIARYVCIFGAKLTCMHALICSCKFIYACMLLKREFPSSVFDIISPAPNATHLGLVSQDLWAPCAKATDYSRTQCLENQQNLGGGSTVPAEPVPTFLLTGQPLGTWGPTFHSRRGGRGPAPGFL